MPISPGTIRTVPIHNTSGDSCEIMGPAGTLVQISMGLLAFLILAFKRTRENPKREWKVWALDTSKQGISGGVAHILNVVSAMLIASHEAEKSNADSCAWYLVNMLFDTSIGSMFNISILLILENFFTKRKLEYLKSGNYFSEKNVQEDILEAEDHDRAHAVHIKHVYIDINYLAWALQLIIWCGIVSVVKTFLFFLQLHLSVPLGNFGASFMRLVDLHGLMKLIFVLVLVPTILNSIQFWITDNFLKKKIFSDEDLAAQNVYFQMKTLEKKPTIARSRTSIVKGNMGQNIVLQISRSPSVVKASARPAHPAHPEKLVTHVYKPPETTTEGPTTEVKRSKSF